NSGVRLWPAKMSTSSRESSMPFSAAKMRTRRAVEGVPRDALNLAAKIATKAFGNKIAMDHVRNAARDWYQQDKEAVIRGNPDLDGLLTKVIDEIIGQRKARAFLFPSSVRDDRIEQLFDARVLHVLKKNTSSRDE